MKVVTGNIVELAKTGQYDVILHGCNCFHTMRAGVARALADEFPEVLESDRLQSDYGDQRKLGYFSLAEIVRADYRIWVANLYTQFGFNRHQPQIIPQALVNALIRIRGVFGQSRILYPKIGAGLAGGNWAGLENIFNSVLYGCDHTLCVLDTDTAKVV